MSKRNMLSKVIETVNLDQDLHPNLPIVEIAGPNQLLIENHLSIVKYNNDLIIVKVMYGSISIRGYKLEILKMSREQLVIHGTIETVELNSKGEF